MPGPEFLADGVPHRARDLHAYGQFTLLRAVLPALPAISAMQVGSDVAGSWGVAAALAPLEAASDEDIAAAFSACADVCERQAEDGGWEPATKAMPLGDVLRLTMAAVGHHLGDYFAIVRPSFSRTMGQIPNFEPVEMPDGEGWFWRPVEEGRLPAIAATDGVHRLWHFAKVNDVLDVRVENEARARKAAEKG